MENDIFEIFKISCITWLSAQGFSLGLDLARSPPLRWKKSKFYHFFKFNLLLGVGGFLQTIQICYCLLSTCYLFFIHLIFVFLLTCYLVFTNLLLFCFTCYLFFIHLLLFDFHLLLFIFHLFLFLFTCYCLFIHLFLFLFTCYCLFIHLLLLTISSTRVSPPSSSTSWQYLSGLTWNNEITIFQMDHLTQKLF